MTAADKRRAMPLTADESAQDPAAVFVLGLLASVFLGTLLT